MIYQRHILLLFVLFLTISCGGMFNRFEVDNSPMAKLSSRFNNCEFFVNDLYLTKNCKKEFQEDAQILAQKLLIKYTNEKIEVDSIAEDMIFAIYNYLVLIKISDPDKNLEEVQRLYIHINKTIKNISTNITFDFNDNDYPTLHYYIQYLDENQLIPKVKEWKILFNKSCVEKPEVQIIQNDKLPEEVYATLRTLAKEELIE